MDQFISALCTLAIIVLAILVMTRAISLEDALKAIGKMLILVFAFAVHCA